MIWFWHFTITVSSFITISGVNDCPCSRFLSVWFILSDRKLEIARIFFRSCLFSLFLRNFVCFFSVAFSIWLLKLDVSIFLSGSVFHQTIKVTPSIEPPWHYCVVLVFRFCLFITYPSACWLECKSSICLEKSDSFKHLFHW